mmetsp:Transcript_2003/g.3805  ORF Transcript_2003/g.3805 Transcript_2003/m.3805 type:complete len:357 (-) Transcript_2003:503-1573(-)
MASCVCGRTKGVRKGKDGKPLGELKISVIAAKNLPAGHKDGTSDPWVSVSVQGERKWGFSTEVKEKTKDCVWNEDFAVKRICDFKWIDFIVKSKNFMGSTELGRATINEKSHKLSRWPQEIKLILDHGGELTIKVQISYNIDPLFTPYCGTLSLKILEAKDLKDSTVMFGKQSTYCRVNMCGEEYKTEVAKNAGTTAKWPDITFEFKVKDVNNDPMQDINLTVLAEGTLLDGKLGTLDLPLSLLLSHKKQWWSLFSNREMNVKQGKILLEADFKGTGGYPKTSLATIKKASYGVGERQLDVTSVCEGYMKDGKLLLTAPASLDWVFACDPYRNQTKVLEVEIKAGMFGSGGSKLVC